MRKFREDKINAIATATTSEVMKEAKEFAVNSIVKQVKEETGKDIRVTSLEPLKYEVLTENVYQLRAFLYNTVHYHIFRGHEEFCLHCIDYGMTVYDFGKKMTFNGKEYKLVGFFENTNSKYFLLMYKRGGLYIKRYEK